MTFKRGYDEFSAKPLVPASEAAVIQAQATADAALAASPAPDGSPPATNPTIEVRPGIGSLFVVWDPITNADPVTYDVYAVPAADVARLAYPPLTTDHVGEADGTGAAFRALPDGTDLTPIESYAVAVYARDADGQCATSATPVIASPAQVTSEDLALNALTVDHLTGNDALFIALRAEEIVGVNITGSTVIGAQFQTGDGSTGGYWRMGNISLPDPPPGYEDVNASTLEVVSGFSPEMASEATVHGITGETAGVQQATGVAMSSGQFGSHHAPASMVVHAVRNSSDGGTTWTGGSTTATVTAERVDIISPDHNNGPADINIDAQGNGGSIGLYAKHVEVITHDLGGGDSVNVATGLLVLEGDEGVTIDGPTIAIDGPGVTIDGVPHSGAAAVGKTARLRKTAAQSTPAVAAWTILTFDADAPAPYVVSSSWFTNSAGTFTCVTSGFYSLTAAVLFTSGAAGTRRIISIVRNGVRWIRNDISAKATAAAAAGVSVSDSIYFDVGDTLRIEVYQDSGAALNTTSADGSDHASLSITRTA